MRVLDGSRIAALSLAAFLVACGGGGEGDSAANPPVPPASTNAAPTIQGQPGTSILAGSAYSFQATASDPNGDPLTFTAANLPGWLSLNASTGMLSGAPSAADVGTFAGIVLSVSDGKASASLAAFGITVTAVASGSVTLSWDPPVQNTDGSALTDLAGYRILYGRTANDLSQSVSLTNLSISTYMLENLTSGAWYFAVVAVNVAGMTSSLSNVATKTIG